MYTFLTDFIWQHSMHGAAVGGILSELLLCFCMLVMAGCRVICTRQRFYNSIIKIWLCCKQQQQQQLHDLHVRQVSKQVKQQQTVFFFFLFLLHFCLRCCRSRFCLQQISSDSYKLMPVRL